MNILFLSGFEKDLAEIKDKKLAKIILECIQQFESAKSLDEIQNIKKLKGHSSAFRIRKGDYRIGFFLEGDTVVFAAFATRGKIYYKFP